MLKRLGSGAARHHWAVIGAWIVLAVGLSVAAHAWGSITRDVFTIPGTNSQQALEVLQEDFPASADPSLQVVFHARSGTLRTPQAQEAIAGSVAGLQKLPGAGSVPDPFSSPLTTDQLVSKDGTIAYVTVPFSLPINQLPPDMFELMQQATGPATDAGLEVAFGGVVADSFAQQGGLAEHADEIGLAIALVILLLSLRGVVSALVPIGIAGFAVGVSSNVVSLLENPFDIGTPAPILGMMIGLGVGIDYSLFILSRYRQELADGHDPVDAAGIALGTSGAAVGFAAITVCLALVGLVIVGVPYVTTMGLIAALFVAIAVAAALTFLPAVLGALGHHVNAASFGRQPEDIDPATTASARMAGAVARRPVVFSILGVALLVLLAVPTLSMKLGFTDDGDDPVGTTERTAYDLISQGFGQGANGPLLVAVQLPADTSGQDEEVTKALIGLTEAIGKTPGVAGVLPPIPNAAAAALSGSSNPGTTTTTTTAPAAPPAPSTTPGTLSPAEEADLLALYEKAVGASKAVIIQVTPSGAPNGNETKQLVKDLRSTVLPQAVAGTPIAADDVSVGGVTALLIDLTAAISEKLLWFIVAVVALTFVLLMAAFRSIVVPVNSAVMILLTIGGAYGVVVAVFQWGWANGVVGLSTTVPVVAFVPVMMFAVLFGLSMDYQVFVLSRIREEFVETGEAKASIVSGVAKTSRVITSAALIMTGVFLAFVTNPTPTVKMIGLGMAVAVLIAGFLVRGLLVPSTLSLTAKANWWLPGWLERVLPHLAVEGGAADGASDRAGAPTGS